MSVMDDLGQPLSTLAFCWRLERRDGVAIGLTSHDRDLVIDGFPYRAAPGMRPSAIRQGMTLDPQDMEISGALHSDALSAVDLEAGRWDGAAVALWLTQWEAPGVLWLALCRGTIGGVERRGDAFTAEMKGAAAVLEAAVAPATSPDCRAMLGDRQCRVDMGGRRHVAQVIAVEGERVAIEGLEAGVYAFGSLRWMSGPNCGIGQAVIDGDAGSVTLAEAPPFAVEPGTRVMLTQGCDRQMATCAGRFGNAANFRGEPWLPGNDLLTRYPGA